MLCVNGKYISSQSRNGKYIAIMYLNGHIIYQSVRSCFGSGAWINEKPWINEEGWKNN